LSSAEIRRTAVLGLGNPVVSDDRVGLAVAQEVQRLLAQSPVENVEVLESTRGGFELIDLLSGFSHAVIIDCLAVPDPVPGRIRRLTLDNVAGSARLVNVHEISIGEAFELARRLDTPMPKTVDIYAVEGGDVSTMSEEMTPPVEAAVGPLARQIHESLAGKMGAPRA
jgi:hydrogenase maturation protease